MSLTQEDKDWIQEQLHDTETRLLRGFEGWVSQITQESRSHSVRQREYEERLDLINARINELEKWKRETEAGGEKK